MLMLVLPRVRRRRSAAAISSREILGYYAIGRSLDRRA
jgi:hypothetical protein